LGYVLATLGMIGVIISLAGETSDYVDPLTFAFATASILVAIVGIALAFKTPSKDAGTKQAITDSKSPFKYGEYGQCQQNDPN
jgi:hypothetical protein